MTIEEILKQTEGQYFDRKRATTETKDLANCAMGFANAEGGQLAIGIENDGTPSGFENCSDKESEIREFLSRYITSPLDIEYSKMPFENKGRADFVFLVSVRPSSIMHENMAKEVTLRVGRETHFLNYEEIRYLKLDKGLQRFESEGVKNAGLEDIETDLVSSLGKIIGISVIETVLVARDLAERKNEVLEINFAGVLLLGIKPQKWVERARIRIIRYEGTEEKTGINLNIVKDLFFEGSLVKQLKESAAAIQSLLREFTKLDSNTGRFITNPEYPPFAWKEALVNAVTHREYALSGADIQVKIFDDRVEIISPGNFPSTVREDNIKDTHFSRNPKIARVLGDFGYVRELGEGVNRIYQEMADSGLPDPLFRNPPGSVIVTLKNDISHRQLRKYSDLRSKILETVFNPLSEKEKTIVLYVLENEKITKRDVARLIKMSSGTSISILKKMQERKPPILLPIRLSTQDPKAHYVINPEILVHEGAPTQSLIKPVVAEQGTFW